MSINVFCNKGSHIDAMKFAIFCINYGIPLDKLSDEEYKKVCEAYNKWLEIEECE